MRAKVCIDINVSGKVQGVGYRAFVRHAAHKNGVNGWAKNLPDGCVAVRLCGESSAVADVERALHQGPKWSSVSSVQAQSIDCENLQEFWIG